VVSIPLRKTARCSKGCFYLVCSRCYQFQKWREEENEERFLISNIIFFVASIHSLFCIRDFQTKTHRLKNIGKRLHEGRFSKLVNTTMRCQKVEVSRFAKKQAIYARIKNSKWKGTMANMNEIIPWQNSRMDWKQLHENDNTILQKHKCQIKYSSVASPNVLERAKKLGVRMFDFRWITLLCLGYEVSKHKMSIYAKIWGGPWSPGPPGYAYDQIHR